MLSEPIALQALQYMGLRSPQNSQECGERVRRLNGEGSSSGPLGALTLGQRNQGPTVSGFPHRADDAETTSRHWHVWGGTQFGTRWIHGNMRALLLIRLSSASARRRR
jgi:hypothetical protein